MIRTAFLSPLLFALCPFFLACSSDDSAVVEPGEEHEEGNQQELLVPEPLDLKEYSSGQKVMMQTFYWDVEPRHQWWANLSGKVEDWAQTGIDRIWLPVATKGQSGGYSMGYDPSDYFDFGEYDQHGTIPTRFGTRKELEALISTSHDLGMEVIADIVLNHNSGGGAQYNPYRDKSTYTLFDQTHGNASGMFNRSYEHFHPNDIHESDEGDLFFSEQDLCHHQAYVQDWLWRKENSVAKYYKNQMGFDGWRFDYVKGFGTWVIKQWMQEVGGFAVGENWDGNSQVLEQWVEETGIRAFDFAAFYKMEEAFDRHDDLSFLEKDMLRKKYPEQAVTFVANHDTEKDQNPDNRIALENKLKAYAYILTHDGYPTIFYSDYENEDLNPEIKQLIALHNSLATGAVEVLYVDRDEYVMRRNGAGENPGLILYINTGSHIRRRKVQTNWKNIPLVEYSGNSTFTPISDENGLAEIEAPADGYAIWSASK